MQVFVPLYTYADCAAALDDRRLFKQLVEAYQVLNTLLDRPMEGGKERRGWRSHPAVHQWSRWPRELLAYAQAARAECARRGFRTERMAKNLESLGLEAEEGFPDWWGEEAVHSSHRARLLQKAPSLYSGRGWPEEQDPGLASRPYVWVRLGPEGYRLEPGPAPV